MKRDCRLIFLLLLLQIYPLSSSIAQKTFEGIIRYRISIPANTQQNIPEFMEYYLNENNLMLRIFLKNGDELARVLFLGKEQTLFMIDDVQKTAMKVRVLNEELSNPGSVPDQFKDAYEKAIEDNRLKELNEQYDIVETGIVENIAGYPCKKYKVKDDKKLGNTFVWITEKIFFNMPMNLVGEDNPLFRFMGKEGFPLKLQILEEKDGLIEMESIEIASKKLNDELFMIPSTYQISDISSLMRGN